MGRNARSQLAGVQLMNQALIVSMNEADEWNHVSMKGAGGHPAGAGSKQPDVDLFI